MAHPVRPFDERGAAQAVAKLIHAVGEDIDREGLQDTPERVSRAWREMLQGYHQDPTEVLATTNGEAGFRGTGYEQMIVLAHYPMTSTCEHHMLPFLGEVDVGYMPGADGMVVGLSKLGRLVDVYARRLQVQERLTQQIATALDSVLNPRGVGVRIRSVHQCMTCRGVRKGGLMVTEALLGSFQEHAVRDEFWHLANTTGRTT